MTNLLKTAVHMAQDAHLSAYTTNTADWYKSILSNVFGDPAQAEQADTIIRVLNVIETDLANEFCPDRAHHLFHLLQAEGIDLASSNHLITFSQIVVLYPLTSQRLFENTINNGGIKQMFCI